MKKLVSVALMFCLIMSTFGVTADTVHDSSLMSDTADEPIMEYTDVPDAYWNVVNHELAQEFVADGNTVYGVMLPLNLTSGTPSITISIRSALGNETTLKSFTETVNGTTDGMAWYTIRFDSGIELSKGTHYFLFVSLTGHTVGTWYGELDVLSSMRCYNSEEPNQEYYNRALGYRMITKPKFNSFTATTDSFWNIRNGNELTQKFAPDAMTIYGVSVPLNINKLSGKLTASIRMNTDDIFNITVAETTKNITGTADEVVWYNIYFKNGITFSDNQIYSLSLKSDFKSYGDWFGSLSINNNFECCNAEENDTAYTDRALGFKLLTEPASYTLGDIDCNNSIAASDALMALQTAVNLITLTDTQTFSADVNDDQKITAVDALLILQFSVKRITKFPAEDHEVEAPISVSPSVQYSNKGNNKMNISSVNIISNDTTTLHKSYLEEVLTNSGIALNKTAQVTISLSYEYEKYVPYNNEEDGYTIYVKGSKIYICANSSRGMHYAIQTFEQLIDNKTINDGTVICDYPAVQTRGVIEGFYGTPWSHTQRVDMIKYIGSVKMNTYIYAPKDDPKHRDLWRESYEGAELKNLQELINTSKENYVDFVFAISPGKDFDFGSGYEKDMQTLLNKCDEIYDMGVRSFAVLLDDLPTQGLKVENHAKLINDFRQRFYADHDGLKELITVFAEYCSNTVTSYTNIIAAELDKRVIVMWTGADVLDPSLSKSGIQKINSTYGRNVIIWRNFPVNDYCANNLLMSGDEGLTGSLSNIISGFVSNPMNQPEASKISLYTISDFLWNSNSYNSSFSLENSYKYLYPNTSEAVKLFSEVACASAFNGNIDSKEYTELIKNFKSAYSKHKDLTEPAQKLLDIFGNLSNAIDTIRTSNETAALASEIDDWLTKGKAYCEMVSAALNALMSDDTETFWSNASVFNNAYNKISNNQRIVSQYVIAPFIVTLKTYIKNFYSASGSIIKPSFDRVFESAKVSASLPSYDNSLYAIENATDDKSNTYFWWKGASIAGSYIQLDLGEVKRVFNIIYESGAGGHTSDYLRYGTMQYSVDGSNWVTIGDYTSMNVTIEALDIDARYVRYMCTKDQEYWLTVSMFAVNYTFASSDITVSPCGNMGFDFNNMFDGNLTSTYISTITPKANDELVIQAGVQINSLECFQLTNSSAKVEFVTNGIKTDSGTLDSLYKILKGNYGYVDEIHIKWDPTAKIPNISEIIIK